MDDQQLTRIVEGALLAANRPLTVAQLQDLFDLEDRPEARSVREALKAIAASCEERGFALREVASGWRFQVDDDLGPWISRLWEEKPQRYSRAMMETLALIAYRQPITRGDIEDVRGVSVSSNIIKTLMEREWIKVVGHKDVPGRPALYATTRAFLDYFNLKSLDELPTLAEIRDLDELSGALALDTPPGDGEGNDSDSGDEGGNEPAPSPDTDSGAGAEQAMEAPAPSGSLH